MNTTSTASEPALTAATLKSAVDKMTENRGPISHEDYKKLIFLCDNFHEACDRSRDWAALQIHTYNQAMTKH